MRAIVIIAVLGLTGCQNANQFDLVCDGTLNDRVKFASYTTLKKVSDHSMRFSIDLNREGWCYSETCQESHIIDISEITPAELKLNSSTRIDRNSGYIEKDFGASVFQGRCKKAPFTRPERTKF